MHSIQKSKVDLLHGILVLTSFQTTGCMIESSAEETSSARHTPNNFHRVVIFRSDQLQKMDFQSIALPLSYLTKRCERDSNPRLSAALTKLSYPDQIGGRNRTFVQQVENNIERGSILQSIVTATLWRRLKRSSGPALSVFSALLSDIVVIKDL
jgi:hypothetical protein